MRKAKQMLAGLLATLLMMQALPVTVLADDAAAPAQPAQADQQPGGPAGVFLKEHRRPPYSDKNQGRAERPPPK